MAPTTSPPTAASIEPTVTLACGEVRASCDQLRVVLDAVARGGGGGDGVGIGSGAAADAAAAAAAADGGPPPFPQAVTSAAADALVRLKEANRLAATAAAGALRRERAALATRIAAVVAAMPPLPPAAAAVRDDDVHDDGGGGGAPADAAAAAAAVHGRRLAALDAELAHRRDLLSATDRVGAAKRDSLRRRAAAEAFLAKLPAHARAVASSVAPTRAF
ncbi:hypothetical protein I4F81_004838 [Pyropia yezoensis]|uniref:Uncharacterized protein n=1 Tax=Pyropia yezoensis TaxID=2788 RepID=A0ACC3BW72_PYRYE|nr:hypothetical protein I4F81_004838 [Neopyropia yezoensis]